MTEPAAPAAPACKAVSNDGLTVCASCGFEWPDGADKPACDPITFETLRMRMIEEATRAEASLLSVIGLGSKGMPTDGGAQARRRLAEIEAVLRLVERVAGSRTIKDLLNKKDKP